MLEIFFDKSIILQKSNNILFDINIPIFKQNVLQPDQSYEGDGNAYYKIINKNNTYQLYYRGINQVVWIDIHNKICNSTESSTQFEEICYTESQDGLYFTNKCCLSKKLNNIDVLKNSNFCHNFFPYYDEKNKKYIAISGTGMFNNGLFLFESQNGIDWIKIKKIIDANDIIPGWTHPNHFDSHNSIVYNSFDDYYYIYLRHNQTENHRRFVQFTKTKDFNNFTKIKKINIDNDDKEGIYNFNVFMYPNSYYFIALPCVSNQQDLTQKISNQILYSINGEDWYYLSNKFINLKTSYFITNNIVYSNDNKELYFYIHDKWSYKENCLDCYSIEKDRISKIICNNEGFIQTKLINLINNNITLNYECINEDGWIVLQLIDINNNLFIESLKYKGNELDKEIEWNNNIEFQNNQYYIKFIMCDCNLYSFSYNI